MSQKLSEAIQLPNLTPTLQLVDYWTELAAIASYAWFNSAMIFTVGAAENE
jgi:hypothetical protein